MRRLSPEVLLVRLFARFLARFLTRTLPLLLACAVFLPGQTWADTCRRENVEVQGDWGQAAFQVEVADTAKERSRGLMFREYMPRRSGMLFVYESSRQASFWMKNTLIELDMLFADVTGKVTRVHHRAIPGDLTPIDGGPNVYAVLEINGGLAREFGIVTGNVLRHPAFSNGPAAWPC